MYLFFDTETTGLPKNWQAPISDLDNWPRIVQLAWILSDEKENEIFKQNYIIKPEGFLIPEESSRVHGISTEQALKEGVDLESALKHFKKDLEKSSLLVAHNINFDFKIISAEFLRKKINSEILDNIFKLCTMESTTNYCQIEKERGYGYKWPRLDELHWKLFKEGFDDAHNALADVQACARCFFEIKKRGIIK